MTILPRHKDVAKSRLKMSNPWHLLAVGFGSGLSPSKSFGAEDSHKFVNGVLDKAAPVIRPNKK